MIPSTNRHKIDARIERELVRSIVKHGMWDQEVYPIMCHFIIDEIEECFQAAEDQDYSGEHGMFNELAQVAACCIKAMNQLIERGDHGKD